jgi:hypothetical protein
MEPETRPNLIKLVKDLCKDENLVYVTDVNLPVHVTIRLLYQNL